MILYMLSKVFTSYTSYASDNIFEEELNLLIDFILYDYEDFSDRRLPF